MVLSGRRLSIDRAGLIVGTSKRVLLVVRRIYSDDTARQARVNGYLLLMSNELVRTKALKNPHDRDYLCHVERVAGYESAQQ